MPRIDGARARLASGCTDLRTLDPQLAPYPYGDAAKIWNELSRHVRPEHVRALLPPGGRYTPVPDAVAAPDEAPADPKAIAPTATALRFTPFDLRRSFPPDATPAEVTRYSLDKSWLLSHVVLQRWQPARTHSAPSRLGPGAAPRCPCSRG